ncbi:MAG TPA: DNA-binding protein [Burkholderiaceae bacterium]|nr:DNA-binding protein [Burkholderiaceae bacterium]
MSKAGIYKSDVKTARDALLAQGKHPSVDAVRVALGNTGSKTTIHKYLKELETEDGGVDGRRISISEMLQNLVERLAAQLQDEANTRIDAVRVEQAALEKQHAEALAVAQREAAYWRGQAQQFEVALESERAGHARTREVLQQETITRHTAEQRASGLEARLAENEVHRHSLEDKHRHAYEALEHYRQSTKEQREQDQRRHEQQLQQLQAELRAAQQTIVVKQEDVTRLNQEGARLIADLTHARQVLQDEQDSNRRLAQRIEALQATERRAEVLHVHSQGLQEQLAVATAKIEGLLAQVRQHELAAAAAHAKLSAQEEMVADFRASLSNRSAEAG